MSARTRHRGASSLAVLSLLAGMLGLGLVGPAASAQAASAEPVIGECRDLTLEEAYEDVDTTTPIDCSEDHTARVVAVGTLPDDVRWSERDEVTRAVGRTCRPTLEETLGTTDKARAMSAYTFVWFMPTKAEREGGARWFRCDLVLLGGTTLVDLPTDDVPALSALPHPDEVARCLVGDRLLSTTCARKHRARATGAFSVRQATYPGEARLGRLANRRCPQLVSTERFWYTFPLRTSWKYTHVVTCFSRTSD